MSYTLICCYSPHLLYHTIHYIHYTVSMSENTIPVGPSHRHPIASFRKSSYNPELQTRSVFPKALAFMGLMAVHKCTCS